MHSTVGVGEEGWGGTWSASRVGRRLLRSLANTGIALVVPLFALGIWWLLAAVDVAQDVFLPSPPDVFNALREWVFGGGSTRYSGTWFDAAANTLRRVTTGFLLGAVVGVGLGGVLGYFPPLGKMVEPFIHVLRAIPIIGWLPISLAIFGFDSKSAIFLVGLGVFFPVVVNTIAGVRSVPLALMRVGYMVGAGPAQLLRHIVIPSALPHIVTGLRIGMGFAWILCVVAEWVAVRNGLGYVLLDSYNLLRYDFVIAAMLSVGLVGALSDRVVTAISRPVLKWHSETTLDGR